MLLYALQTFPRSIVGPEKTPLLRKNTASLDTYARDRVFTALRAFAHKKGGVGVRQSILEGQVHLVIVRGQ